VEKLEGLRNKLGIFDCKARDPFDDAFFRGEGVKVVKRLFRFVGVE
jgi:hypothetical protein